MFTTILTREQQEVFPYLKMFKRSFYLVGGTALALQINHRRSIDFDLFCSSPLVKSRIRRKLQQVPFDIVFLSEDIDQLHLRINGVKTTFFSFPYDIKHPVDVDSMITSPELPTLASMKAFALGRRAKWKDYVDLYFLLRDHFSISEISCETQKIFPSAFSEKLFREQLAYHADINYSEPVEFIGREIPAEEIREFLIDRALDI